MKEMENLFLDVSTDIEKEFEREQQYCIMQTKVVPSVERYLEIEIQNCYDHRYAETPPVHVYFDNDISLREYFNEGWDSAEIGLEEDIPKKFYVWGKATLKKIEIKYSSKELPSDYMQRLNKLAIEEYVRGAALAWFYHWLKKELNKIRSGEIAIEKEKVKTIPIPETIDELFLHPELAEECIQLLRETDPPTINEGYQFIGKNKGIMKVWYDALKYKGLLKAPFQSDQIIVQLLMKKFEGLTIDASLLRKPNLRAMDYKADFESELFHIKTK
jgi:hypothetical protein